MNISAISFKGRLDKAQITGKSAIIGKEEYQPGDKILLEFNGGDKRKIVEVDEFRYSTKKDDAKNIHRPVLQYIDSESGTKKVTSAVFPFAYDLYNTRELSDKIHQYQRKMDIYLDAYQTLTDN